MIRYFEALKRIRDAAGLRGLTPEETVPLGEALGRVTARRVESREALPPFDNSSMDGYAVRASETFGAPVWLPVRGAVAAGDVPLGSAEAGAYEINTGAPIPKGCDAVVPIEHVNIMDGGRAVEVLEAANPGDYVRPRGRDYPVGAPVFEAGTRLEPRHVLACAALGVSQVPARRRPRVGLISTGRELVEPGRAPGPGQIHNATAAYLLAALPELGAEPVWLGTVPDEPEDFKRLVGRGLELDFIVSTGAVSKGRHDFVAAALKELGAELLYHNVAIRPGKPGLFARFERGPLFFGLPGNPLSTVVGLRFFVKPALDAVLGAPPERPRRLPLEADVPKPDGLRCFFKARGAKALPGQASFQIKPLLEADGWLVLPEEGDLARAGLEVEVYPL